MKVKPLITGLVLIILLPVLSAASGIITPFTKCNLNNLKPGIRHSIKELNTMPLKIKNTGNSVIEICVEVVKPTNNELKEYYEIIPDTTWISVECERFTVKPGEWVETDIFISIPDKKLYAGRRFQVFILSQATVKDSKIQTALKSKIFFTVSKMNSKNIFKKLFGWIN